VAATFAYQFAAMLFEMSNEVTAFHAVTVKRFANNVRSRSVLLRKRPIRSSTSATASFRFARVSSRVAPCVFATGEFFDKSDVALGDFAKHGC